MRSLKPQSISQRALRLGLGAITLAFASLIPRAAFAHPMGNFSISHFAGIRLQPGAVEIRYILDMAEIPTFQEMQATGIVPKPDDPRVIAYLARKAQALRTGLVLALNGQPLVLETVSEDVIFPPGAGGLPTMKIGFVYRALVPDAACKAGSCKLDYRDANSPDRAGWKEIVATAASGVALTSSTASANSRSQELANYPTDLINSPPQDLSAQLTFAMPAALAAGLPANGVSLPSARPSPPSPHTSTSTSSSGRGPGPLHFANHAAGRAAASRVRAVNAAPDARPEAPSAVTARSTGVATVARNAPATLALKANQQGTPRNRFTELIASSQWGLWFLLTAALIAAALGGLHALEPGHGKTIVAAYLVGSQGTAAHALLLGLVVTATHTAGVYALGLVTLYASKYVVPDHLYPWLGITSGLTIVVLGLYMLHRRYAGHTHEDGHEHGHDHHHHHHGLWGHSHSHVVEHEHHDHANAAPVHEHVHEHVHAHGGHHHHHDYPGPEHSQSPAKPFSYRQLVALGVTGGIVPCPAALVVLLSAVSLHRVAFGLYLILAFSIGLAAVLISIGLATVYARKLLARVPVNGPVINRWLPMASAAAITCLGVAIVVQGLLSMGVLRST